MDDQITTILGVVILIAIVVALFKGALKTFQRNWIAALLLLIILTPIWAIWAFIEVFTGDIDKAATQPTSNNQSVNVTLINQVDGTTKRVRGIQSDEYPEVIDARVVNDEQILDQSAVSVLKDDTKECRYCAETVRLNAVVCRYCSRDI
jgi:hypothetical protein